MSRRKKRVVRRQDLEPARKRLGYTQQEIADRLGVHVRTWAKWISGERTCPWTVWLAIEAIDKEHLTHKKHRRGRKSRGVKKGA